MPTAHRIACFRDDIVFLIYLVGHFSSHSARDSKLFDDFTYYIFLIIANYCYLIFQYQRWLYPVDKSRMDDGHGEFTENDITEQSVDKANSKKNK